MRWFESLDCLAYAASPFGRDAQIFYLAISENKIEKRTFSLMSYYLLSIHWHLCFDVTHHYILSSVLPKEVGVSAGVKHQKLQLVTYLLPNQQPVGLDVALPLALTVAVEHVWPVNFGQSPVAFEQLDDGTKLVHRIATLDATLQVLLKLVGSGDLVCHQIPILLKNSSLLA